MLYMTVTTSLENVALARSGVTYRRCREKIAKSDLFILNDMRMEKLSSTEVQESAKIGYQSAEDVERWQGQNDSRGGAPIWRVTPHLETGVWQRALTRILSPSHKIQSKPKKCNLAQRNSHRHIVCCAHQNILDGCGQICLQ